MPNKSQAASTQTEIGSTTKPPVPVDYGPTVSAVAAIFSIIAIALSIWTANYSRRSDRRSRFDSDFGSPLRTALRELERTADELSAFIFPSAKSVDELKNELQNTQAKIEEKALAAALLVREIDTSTTVTLAGWEQKFVTQAEAARNRLESIYSPSIDNIAALQARADQTRSDYRALVAEARTEIDRIRRGCLKDRV